MVVWVALYANRNSDRNLYVRYLYWNGKSWNWNYNWLDNDFNSNNPAAVAGNSPHFSPFFMLGEFSFESSFTS